MSEPSRSRPPSHASAIGALLGSAERLLPPGSRAPAARLFDGVTESIDALLGRRDPLTPPLRLRLHAGPFVDARQYRASAAAQVDELFNLVPLGSDARVLEIGCGPGRIAAALSHRLGPRGSYDGFDLAAEPVAWCSANISTRFPSFQFRSLPILSPKYNPDGRLRPSEVSFPFESSAYDVVIALSVYTHMFPEAIARYLAETYRVLRPGGASVASFYLLDARSLARVREGTTRPSFPYPFEGYRTESREDREGFVAQDAELIGRLYGSVGLVTDGEPWRGSWAAGSRRRSSEPSVGGRQDVLVARRPG